MGLNTKRRRLTDNEIQELMSEMKKAMPYTDEELADIPYDGDESNPPDFDIRSSATIARNILKEYGVI